MRKAGWCGLVLLVCCSVDKAPETRLADKLRDCDLLSEGKFRVDFKDGDYDCELKCLQNASCGQLEQALCEDSDVETPYERCLDACRPDDERPFECKDGSSDEAYRCDAFEDCEDGSDEASCPADAFFVCDSGERVAKSFECDAVEDCEDGSDEADCADVLTFVCGDGQRLPEDFVCDAEEDCEDGSDERDCDEDEFFTCSPGIKVPAEWVCDGLEDCENGSDEDQGCARLQCGGSEDPRP